jgi:biotin carboxyl carrier protein
MAGKILKLEKRVGEAVEEDDVVLVMEALKMEIPVVAPVAGIIEQLNVSPGQAIEAGQLLGAIR